MGCGDVPYHRKRVGRHPAKYRDGLECLMEAYRPRLVRYAEGLLGGVGCGEDVVQEVFLRLWRRRHELNVSGLTLNLLYTATRNAAIDEGRRRTRYTAAASRANAPSPGPSPLDLVMADELRVAAVKAVDGLPPRRRQIFRLRCLHGLAHREIAAAMDISTQTVANQMTQALRSLRTALDLHQSAAL